MSVENRNYLARSRDYVAPVILASGLLLGSGCATTKSPERNLPKHSNKAYENFSGQSKYNYNSKTGFYDSQKKEVSHNRKSNASRLGDLVGDFIFDFLIGMPFRN